MFELLEVETRKYWQKGKRQKESAVGSRQSAVGSRQSAVSSRVQNSYELKKSNEIHIVDEFGCFFLLFYLNY
ncbi:MAG: hypothetical protein ACRC2O_08380 [Chitinophagaceae bacterium]